MQHIQRYILFILIPISYILNAQTINETQSIALKTIRSIDNIPVAYQSQIKGGYHQCDTVPWSFIPKERICMGMLAYNTSDSSTYRYIGSDFNSNHIASHNTRHDWEKVFIITQYDTAGYYTAGSIVIDTNRLYRAIINIDSAMSVDLSNDTAWMPVNHSVSLSEVLSIGNSADSLNITNLAKPKSPKDATPKIYVDSVVNHLQTNINRITGFTDADGYTYRTVTIGNQTWMAENLRTTKYPNGDTIKFMDNATFASLPHDSTAEGAGVYGVNSNSTAAHIADPHYEKYGVLYTYGSALRACPEGWHLPSTDEIIALKKFLINNGYNTNNDAVAIRAVNEWNATIEATDAFGFKGFPAGFRRETNGEYSGINTNTWWVGDDGFAITYGTSEHSDTIVYGSQQSTPDKGFSVRYIKDGSTANSITNADTANWNNKVDTLIAGDGIIISGDTITAKVDTLIAGDGISIIKDTISTIPGPDSTTQAYIDSVAESLRNNINQKTGFMDANGNTYRTVTIGNQTWMAENLRATKYPDGTDIPFLNDSTFGKLPDTITAEGAGVYGVNSNNTADHIADPHYEKYGVLYTYGSALKACPEGWHLPTSEEWFILTEYLNKEGINKREEGTVLKSATGWDTENPGTIAEKDGNGTDAYGFTALPGGKRKDGYQPPYVTGNYEQEGRHGNWWNKIGERSIEEKISDPERYCSISSNIQYGHSFILFGGENGDKSQGLSVRYVKDNYTKTNQQAIIDTATSIRNDFVDLKTKQTVEGSKTFSDTTFFGSDEHYLLTTSGNDSTLYNLDNNDHVIYDRSVNRLSLTTEGQEQFYINDTAVGVNNNLTVGIPNVGHITVDGGDLTVADDAEFDGNVWVDGSLNTPSDQRLKKNINTLINVLDKIDKIRGVRFEFIDQQRYATGKQIGVIAQELQWVYPELVMEGADGYLSVNYSQLSAVLLQAIKEQQAEINLLKQQMQQVMEKLETVN